MTNPTRHIPVRSGFMMVLHQGDDLFAHLERLMLDADIPSASLIGFGFAGMEVTGLTGTLAWKDGKPAIHTHAAAAGQDFRAVGGHLLGLTVGRGSFELTIGVHDRRLERRFEDNIGANVLQLS